MPLLIYDEEDRTYHYGEGDWGPHEGNAKEYATQEEAERGIEEVDEAEILRDQLFIVVKRGR